MTSDPQMPSPPRSPPPTCRPEAVRPISDQPASRRTDSCDQLVRKRAELGVRLGIGHRGPHAVHAGEPTCPLDKPMTNALAVSAKDW
jgi:hypothetical protein